MDLLRFIKSRKIRCQRGYLLLEKRASVDSESIVEGGNRIAFHSSLAKSYLGFASYIGNNSHLYGCKIGRFCSIGARVIVIRGIHPVNFVSTHPAFYSIGKQCGFSYTDTQKFEELSSLKYDGKYSISIGNDVWIGSDVKIIDGVSIGDGAIIAAGAVVNKDVPPYAIVGGVGIKIIKYRFDEDIIKQLLELKWWNKDEEWLRENACLFTSIERFIDSLNS